MDVIQVLERPKRLNGKSTDPIGQGVGSDVDVAAGLQSEEQHSVLRIESTSDSQRAARSRQLELA